MWDRDDLPRRPAEILVALVRQFIAGGMPIGSKVLAGHLEEPLSSATIRNVMADLETRGYLSQPHTSAGRVPTERAYRYYVDRLGVAARLSRATERYIRDALCRDSETPEELMRVASRLLSEVSENVGLVLAPALEEKLLEHIKFVLLPEHRVLAVIVSKPDLIENKIISVEEDFSQAELDRTANFLNLEFRGWSLRTIRLEIVKRLEADKLLFDRLLKNVATLLLWSALSAEGAGPLFVDGTAKFLERPEFDDVRIIRDLVATFEQKSKLVKVLAACLSSSGDGVRTLIGRENPETGMRACAFVVAPFHYRNRAVGALGVVGPTRMEYERAISAVDFVAHQCSQVLSSN